MTDVENLGCLEGYLLKQATNEEKWRPRYFRFNPNTAILEYWKGSPNDGKKKKKKKLFFFSFNCGGIQNLHVFFMRFLSCPCLWV